MKILKSLGKVLLFVTSAGNAISSDFIHRSLCSVENYYAKADKMKVVPKIIERVINQYDKIEAKTHKVDSNNIANINTQTLTYTSQNVLSNAFQIDASAFGSMSECESESEYE